MLDRDCTGILSAVADPGFAMRAYAQRLTLSGGLDDIRMMALKNERAVL
jgi:hypothetical protein